MPPTFTSHAEEGAYRITFGPDPRVYTVLQGSITVTEDRVEVVSKRPLLLWLVDSTVTGPLTRILMASVLPVLIGVCLLADRVPLLPLLLLLAPWFILLLFERPLIPLRFNFPREAVTEATSAGREIIVVAPEALVPFAGLRLYAKSHDDALSILEAIRQPGQTLPLTSCSQGDKVASLNHKSRFSPALGNGTVRVTADSVALSWEVENPKASYLFFGLFLSGEILIAAGLLLDTAGFTGESTTGMWGFGLATVVGLAIIFLSVQLYQRYQRVLTPRRSTVDIPRANLLEVDRVGKHFLVAAPSHTGKRLWYRFTPRHEEDAVALETTLRNPGTDGREVTCQVRFGAFPLRAFLTFFGQGSLLIEGKQATFVGKRRDSKPCNTALYVTGGLCYLGLAYAIMVLYPVICEPLFTNDVMGPIVLLVPLLLLLILMSIILPLIPLFITQSRTVATEDIRDLRRLGRQITFTADDGGERYVFHLKTPEAAAAVERALGG